MGGPQPVLTLHGVPVFSCLLAVLWEPHLALSEDHSVSVGGSSCHGDRLCTPHPPTGLRMQTPSLPSAHCGTMLLGSPLAKPHLHASFAKAHNKTKVIHPLFIFSSMLFGSFQPIATWVPSLWETTGGLVEASGDILCHFAWKMISSISSRREKGTAKNNAWQCRHCYEL